MDQTHASDDVPPAHPGPQTSPQPAGPGGGSPKPPTAIATEHPGGELLIVNRTGIGWQIEQSHDLIATIGPETEHVAYPCSTGRLVAMPDPRARVQAVLTVALQAARWGLDIDTNGSRSRIFHVRLLDRRARSANILPGSAPVEAVNLMADTQHALNGLGIITLDDALRARVDDILSLQPYPLRVLFDLLEQLHGLQVT